MENIEPDEKIQTSPLWDFNTTREAIRYIEAMKSSNNSAALEALLRDARGWYKSLGNTGSEYDLQFYGWLIGEIESALSNEFSGE
jgi:hypothetical protein